MTRCVTTTYLIDSGYSPEDADFEAICLTGIDLEDESEEQTK